MQRYSPNFLSLRLRHAMGQQDDASEALASAYIEGSRSDTPSLPGTDPASLSQDKSVRRTQQRRLYARAP
jgi:ESCRT-I complex subunit VPS37